MEPRQRAEKLVSIIKAFKAGQQAAAIPGSLAVRNAYTIEAVLEASGQLLRDIRRLRPVVHQVRLAHRVCDTRAPADTPVRSQTTWS
jgi:hypothetical protein